MCQHGILVGAGSRLTRWTGSGLWRRNLRQRGHPVKEPVGPGNKVLPVWAIRVPAVMLTPREVAVEQTHVDGRHSGGLIVVPTPRSFAPSNLNPCPAATAAMKLPW